MMVTSKVDLSAALATNVAYRDRLTEHGSGYSRDHGEYNRKVILHLVAATWYGSEERFPGTYLTVLSFTPEEHD